MEEKKIIALIVIFLGALGIILAIKGYLTRKKIINGYIENLKSLNKLIDDDF